MNICIDIHQERRKLRRKRKKKNSYRNLTRIRIFCSKNVSLFKSFFFRYSLCCSFSSNISTYTWRIGCCFPQLYCFPYSFTYCVMYFPSKINVPTKSKEAKCFTYITNKKPYLHTKKKHTRCRSLGRETRKSDSKQQKNWKKLNTKKKLIFFFSNFLLTWVEKTYGSTFIGILMMEIMQRIYSIIVHISIVFVCFFFRVGVIWMCQTERW